MVSPNLYDVHTKESLSFLAISVDMPSNHHLPAQLSGLLDPAAYPHEVGRIELVETHVSWVLLSGELVYKIKRPVRYPFVDMRTVQQRHVFCQEEVRLNRRFAPSIYLDVVPITAAGGTVRMGGAGEAIEYAVQMRQFDRSNELTQLLAHGHASSEALASFGESLARIHAELPVAEPSAPYGRPEFVIRALLENLQQLEGLSARARLAPVGKALEPLMRAHFQRLAPLLEARREAGYVRECHGDLHCGNVVQIAGGFVAFDCLEFAPEFRFIDVAEDIAFLYMDLGRRAADAQATAFLNAYLETSGDYEAARLIGLYGAHRALVRAKVAALDERSTARADHAAYVTRAKALLEPRAPVLVLMSGFSGSGKTWLAAQLAKAVGALHIRSDVERKRLAGLEQRARTGSAPGAGLYSQDANERTYRSLAEHASHAIAGGFTPIVDATFQRRADRLLFEEVARAAKVRAVMIRCSAPDAVLESRIRERERKGTDASEADGAVLEWQRAHYEPIAPEEGIAVIDVDTSRSAVLEDAQAALYRLLGSSA